MTVTGKTQPYAYCTLITRASYLAGVIVLAHTLKEHKSKYPLIVLYTSSLSADAVRALELESKRTNLILHPIDVLLPRKELKLLLIATRFADTWTKLRVFQLHEAFPQFKTICYLDADMTIRKPLGHIFTEHPLPGPDWIAANHVCCCNLDGDSWAPKEWTKENCPYTPLSHPTALTRPTPASDHPTHNLLNGGMFLFSPSAKLWSDMMEFFNTTPLLSEMMFPDQDFLAEYFRGRWLSLGWQYNALKTMRYWHKNIWRDDEVVVLHYIVDKPWAKRNTAAGVGGYLGNDGETHAWWWQDYNDWEMERGSKSEVVALVRPHVDGGKSIGATNGGACAAEVVDEAGHGSKDVRPLGI
jgi:inositol 3-alpha-galactosyltransferase